MPDTLSTPARPLAGLRVVYAAFEPFPNAKGSGTRITQLVGGLAEAGARVTLATLAAEGDGPLPAGVIHRSLRVAEPNLLRRGLLFRDHVARLLAGLHPEVVHVRGVFEGQAALAYARHAGARCVFEVNGLGSVELPYHYPEVGRSQEFQRKLRALELSLLTGADQLLTQSHTTAAFLGDRGLPAGAWCAVIPNGAEPDDYDPAPSDPEGPLRLFYAGTLAPWQGVAELLMATRRVAREHPVTLALAGSARRRWERQLRRVLRRLKLEQSVALLGPLSREQLARRVSASDVCLAPLRRDGRNVRQGASPIKIFEYMAAGRAVISTDLPCVREIVDDERTGLLATSSRPSALADPILRLARDPELRLSLGAAARAEVIQGSTWRARREQLVQTYVELLARQASASASA